MEAWVVEAWFWARITPAQNRLFLAQNRFFLAQNRIFSTRTADDRFYSRDHLILPEKHNTYIPQKLVIDDPTPYLDYLLYSYPTPDTGSEIIPYRYPGSQERIYTYFIVHAYYCRSSSSFTLFH